MFLVTLYRFKPFCISKDIKELILTACNLFLLVIYFNIPFFIRIYILIPMYFSFPFLLYLSTSFFVSNFSCPDLSPFFYSPHHARFRTNFKHSILNISCLFLKLLVRFSLILFFPSIIFVFFNMCFFFFYF